VDHLLDLSLRAGGKAVHQLDEVEQELRVQLPELFS
jgi:hypothetical protein